jgi:hypothetical protein
MEAGNRDGKRIFSNKFYNRCSIFKYRISFHPRSAVKTYLSIPNKGHRKFKLKNVDLPPFFFFFFFFFFSRLTTGPAAEPSGRFPPPLLAGGGMGTPPVYWHTGGGDLYI